MNEEKFKYDKQHQNLLDSRTEIQKRWHWYELHTFNGWKELGYYIEKGSKGIDAQGTTWFMREQVELIPTKEDRERAWKNYCAQNNRRGVFVDYDELDDSHYGQPF